jgi:3-isopropylmalate/(R)-2-methylmalate dehydratase small subunit
MGVVMDAVRTVRGRAVPLMQANIDTDQIVPHRFLKRVERSGFGEVLFHDWAHDDRGRPDPDFALNRPEYRGAAILISGPNFGSGSSREHAAWAIQDSGFRAVIAPSFADIFRQNSHKIGLLPVPLDAEVVDRLAAAATGDPAVEITIDVEAQTVSGPGIKGSFDIDPFTKQAFLEGIDDIDRTLEREVTIAAHERVRPSHLPTVPTRSPHDNGDPA